LEVGDYGGEDLLVAGDEGGAGFAFLLRGACGHDDDIALPGFGVLGGTDARAGVAVVGGVAKVLDLSVAKGGFGVDEKDFAGDAVILFDGRDFAVSGCGLCYGVERWIDWVDW
jgi:hypothetical protein